MNFVHKDVLFKIDDFKVVHTPNTPNYYEFTLIKNLDIFLESSESFEELRATAIELAKLENYNNSKNHR